jgi:hypothetical protein
MTCNCYFCKTDKKHPDSHAEFIAVSHRLLKSESLGPKDSVPREACSTCGHEQDKLSPPII